MCVMYIKNSCCQDEFAVTVFVSFTGKTVLKKFEGGLDDE